MRTKPAYEVAARALCRFHGHAEDIKFEGKPMWQSFNPEVTAIFSALGYDGEMPVPVKPPAQKGGRE